MVQSVQIAGKQVVRGANTELTVCLEANGQDQSPVCLQEGHYSLVRY